MSWRDDLQIAISNARSQGARGDEVRDAFEANLELYGLDDEEDEEE